MIDDNIELLHEGLRREIKNDLLYIRDEAEVFYYLLVYLKGKKYCAICIIITDRACSASFVVVTFADSHQNNKLQKFTLAEFCN